MSADTFHVVASNISLWFANEKYKTIKLNLILFEFWHFSMSFLVYVEKVYIKLNVGE